MDKSTKELSIPIEALLKKGAHVVLAKRRVFADAKSRVPAGSISQGEIEVQPRVGGPLFFKEGGNTSNLSGMVVQESTGRIFVDTATSRYELLDKTFTGLNIETSLGSVHYPLDAQPAKLDNEIVDFSFKTPQGDRRIYINKPALRSVLLESNGAQIFSGADGRFMILARVGNIHLPFYMSLHGTSGKTRGEWYPFFGYNGEWIIKGNQIDANGKMTYHLQITEIQEKLNSNLRLPQDYLNRETGKITYYPDKPNAPGNDIFDLNNHLSYKSRSKKTDENENEEDARFVAEITGYNPKNVKHNSHTALPWINSIVTKMA